MIKQIKIFSPKDEIESEKAQTILFKNGFSWSHGKTFKYLNAESLVIFLESKRILYSYNHDLLNLSSTINYQNMYDISIIKNFNEFKSLFGITINYNEPKKLVYE